MQVVPGVRRWVIATALLAIPATLVSPILGLGVLGVAACVRWFHRDPDRTVPSSGLVSPADGRITALSEDEGTVRVSIFLGPTDVHVIRAPTGTRVVDVRHIPGSHWPAFTGAVTRNERFRLSTTRWGLTLYAGTVGRRIHSYVDPGDDLERGGRIGHISFGSWVDLALPSSYTMEDLDVVVGERVRAGETVVVASDDPTDGGETKGI